MGILGARKDVFPWEVTLIEDRRNMKYVRGSTWDTKNWGTLTIIGNCNIPYTTVKTGKVCYPWFLVEFTDKTQVVAIMSNIRKGKVKNPNQPFVYDIGFLGQGEYSSYKNKHEYSIWIGMLGRCYSKKGALLHPTYKDCTVHERWHNFQNFCADIPYLIGYMEWKNDKNKINNYDLDKDIRVKGNRVYGPATCMFVLHITNQLEAVHRNSSSYLTVLTYIATRLSDGYTEEFTNQTEFARKWELCSKRVSYRICHAPNLECGGWTFKVKEEIVE